MSIKAVLYLLVVLYALRRSLATPFCGVLTFVYVTYLRPEVFTYDTLTFLRLPFVCSILLVLSSLLHADVDLKLKLRNNMTLFFLFALAGSEFLSTSNAEFPPESYYYAWTFTKTVIFCHFIVALCDSRAKLLQFIGANVIAGGFLAVWAFLQHFQGNVRLEEIGGGNTSNSNGMAALFLLLLPLIVVRFGRDRKTDLVLAALCMVVFLDIIFTQSRSAFVGVVVGGAYFLFAYPGRYKYAALSAMTLLFLIFAASTKMGEESYGDRIGNMLDKRLDADSSAAARKVVWNLALEGFSQHSLIGVGQQQFKYLSKRRMLEDGNYVGATDAHNSFLLMLVEGGALSFACYVSAVLSFFYYTSRIRKRTRYLVELAWAYRMAICLEFSMLAFLITSLAHSYVLLEYFYWVLILPSVLLKVMEKAAPAPARCAADPEPILATGAYS